MAQGIAVLLAFQPGKKYRTICKTPTASFLGAFTKLFWSGVPSLAICDSKLALRSRPSPALVRWMSEIRHSALRTRCAGWRSHADRSIFTGTCGGVYLSQTSSVELFFAEPWHGRLSLRGRRGLTLPLLDPLGLARVPGLLVKHVDGKGTSCFADGATRPT